ncbi:hypothetical protein BDR22DRAFT_892200 [Usnea florida]
MHTFHAFLTALIATLLTTAAPSPSSTSAATPTVTPPSSYYLKIRVLTDHGPNTDKDGLYVSTFHTGMPHSARLSTRTLYFIFIDDPNPALSHPQRSLKLATGTGTADLTLRSFDDASLAFADSGYQEFNLDPTESFGVVMGQDDDGWNPVSTATEYGDGAFFFNASDADLEISGIGWGNILYIVFNRLYCTACLSKFKSVFQGYIHAWRVYCKGSWGDVRPLKRRGV